MEFLSNTNGQLYIFAYLIGSIPFGFLFAKYIAKVDVRKSGSGNIGSTNVLRVLQEKKPSLAKKLSGATLVFDILKGMFALLLGYFLGVDESVMWGIAVFSVLGHCFSIFLLFEGGKGVATGLGVFAFLIPISVALGAIVWLVSSKVFNVVSLSSLLGVVAAVASSFFIYPNAIHTPIVIIGIIIFYKHSENIYRLFTGDEEKIV